MNHPRPIAQDAVERRAPLSVGLLLLAAVFLIAGCGRGVLFRDAIEGSAGETRATLEEPGLHRVLVKLSPGRPPWTSFVLRNAGPEALASIKLWGLGGRDLLNADDAGTHFTPFSLLPEERFACSSENGNLKGTFLWELPNSEPALRGCLGKTKGVKWIAGQGLTPDARPGASSWIDLPLATPVPHLRASVAWEVEGGEVPPNLWVSLNGRTWAKLPRNRQRVDWSTPFELDASVAGRHGFILRVDLSGDRESGKSGPRLLKRLRVMREVQAPGSLREWREGLNEISLSFKSGHSPRLELELPPG